MARPKSATTQAAPVDFSQLPDDGSPVEFRQTFSKHVAAGAGGGAASVMSEEDYETAEWMVERQTASGWATIDTVRPRPYKPQLRQMHGEGKYRITPLDKGKPVESLARIELIGDPTNNRDPAPPAPAATQMPAGVVPLNLGMLPAYQQPYQGFQQPPANVGDEMPSWMQMQLQMQADDRRAQREAIDRQEQRQREAEERREEREFARQEREDARRALEEKRAAEDRRERDARSERLLNFGLQALQAVVPILAAGRQAPPQQGTDVNGQLLGALLTTVNQRPSENTNNTLKDFIEMYKMMQELQPERGEGDGGAGGEFAQLLAAAGPIIAAARGGGQDPAQLQAQVQGYAQQMARQMLSNPAMLQQFVSSDPQGIARTFVRAVKDNPTLMAAVDQAMAEVAEADGKKE
jgi:hypothetical protein